MAAGASSTRPHSDQRQLPHFAAATAAGGHGRRFHHDEAALGAGGSSGWAQLGHGAAAAGKERRRGPASSMSRDSPGGGRRGRSRTGHRPPGTARRGTVPRDSLGQSIVRLSPVVGTGRRTAGDRSRLCTVGYCQRTAAADRRGRNAAGPRGRAGPGCRRPGCTHRRCTDRRCTCRRCTARPGTVPRCTGRGTRRRP